MLSFYNKNFAKTKLTQICRRIQLVFLNHISNHYNFYYTLIINQRTKSTCIQFQLLVLFIKFGKND